MIQVTFCALFCVTRASLVCVCSCFILFQTIHQGKDMRKWKAHFILPPYCFILKQLSVFCKWAAFSQLSFFSLSILQRTNLL